MRGKLTAVICMFCCFIFTGFPVFPYQLPDTGLHKCYDNEKEISCPSPGQPFYGQDAQYQGYEPSYTDNGNGTVTDLNTGLVWQQEHATDRPWEEACEYCEGLTSGGRTDWLLPTKREIASLPDYGVYDPSIDTDYFPDCNWGYWSSSPSTYYSDRFAWFVEFYDGAVNDHYMTMNMRARCVRGGASGPLFDFVNNLNGTVTDKITGLLWQQGDAQNDGEGRTWEEALAFCQTFSLGEHTDWRLPNVRELESLTDVNRFILPSIDPLFDCRSSYYWSSTTHAKDLDQAWYVYFGYGQADYHGKSTSSSYSSDPYCVRCVRGGPGGSFDTPTVTTTAISSITATTASSGGNVTSDGGASVTAKGVCWSTAANPTTSDSHTSDGTGTGSFTSSITGLGPGTTYHVRAYATNSVGTGYGSETVFITTTIGPTAPTLTVTTSGTNVTVSWTSVTGATGYTLYYAPFPYTGPDSIGNIPMGTQTSMSASLWDSAAFYVAVQASDSTGSSGYSNIEYFIIDTSAPTTPINLTATAVSSSQIDLSWDAPTDNVGVAGYNIYRDGNLVASSIETSLVYENDDIGTAVYESNRDGTIVSYIEKSLILPTTITNTNYNDTGLNENTQYCYSISAYDAAGNESELSSQECSKTLEQSQCEGGGLPLVISDLNFPNTVASDSFVSGSVAYRGSFNDIVNPVMAYRVYTNTSTITTYLTSSVPTTNNCRIIFTVPIPEVSGTGTSQFKLVDYVSGDSNWDDNAVSNVLSKTVTIN